MIKQSLKQREIDNVSDGMIKLELPTYRHKKFELYYSTQESNVTFDDKIIVSFFFQIATDK